MRSEHKRITQKRIIESAIKLFSTNGYRATRVKDIAEAAGTTPTTFYRYFKGKSDLARLLQSRINVAVSETLENLDAIENPSRETIRDWLSDYEQMWKRIHVLCDAYWEATSTDQALAAELVPITYKLTDSMDLIKSMPESKERDSFQTRLVLMYLLMDRLIYLVDIQGGNATAIKMLDEFAGILWESIFRARASATGSSGGVE